jgi:hypothetical protein
MNNDLSQLRIVWGKFKYKRYINFGSVAQEDQLFVLVR